MEDGIEQHMSIMTNYIVKQKMNEHWKIEENIREPEVIRNIQKEENKKEKQD